MSDTVSENHAPKSTQPSQPEPIDIPTGKLRRFFSVGSLSSRVAASYLGNKVASWFRSDARQEAAEHRVHLKNAERLAATMGVLKGAVMKVGQLLSIQDGVLPDEFRDVLKQFQSQAPPMHPAYARDVVETELKGKLETLFREWSPKPIAAASLGQVHRAVLPSGEVVAVKVQYPGIEDTIESDLKNLRTVVRSLSWAGRSFDLREAFEEIEEMLSREVDYLAEARHAEMCADALRDLEREVKVPRVYRELTTRRVITLEFLEGRHLDEFVAHSPDPATRNAMAERMARLIWRLEFTHGLLHADPHPGNYLFLPDGRIGLLDFGCVKVFTPGFLAPYRGAIEAILDRDDARLLDCYVKLAFLGASELDTEKAREYVAWSYLSCEPLLYDGIWPGDWADFLRRLHEKLRDMALKLGIYMPKESVYLDRVLLGIMCFWNRLDTRINWYRAIREVLAEPLPAPAPASTVPGAPLAVGAAARVES